MNCIFRSLFNTRLGVFQAVSENTRTRSKQSGSKTNRHSKGAVLLGSLGLLLSPLALADLPSGANIVHGNASITSSGQAMQINQSSHQLITDWQRFNIGAGHSVTFNQPSAASVALNRVVGSDASTILGNLNANGQVFLVNPNGILFGQGAQVNVGGLVASTLDIRNEDFLNGNYQFQSDTTPAGILNQGSITAADGGVVALLGGRVSNEGVIQARLGSVALAAGQAITLDFAGDGLLSVQIDQATLDALVENHQLIQADGGQVLLTASAADALLQTVVNNTGVIQARTLEERAGQIVLLGDFAGGTVEVAGTLDASVPESGNGGFIDTSGHRVRIDDSVEITTRATEGETGTWLIDPDGFTIGQGGDITGATLSSQLLDNNVELESVQGTGGDGHIHVNDAVSWSQNTLTLSATNNIYVNNVMTATGSASFVANYGSGTDADGVPYGLYTAFGTIGSEGTFAGRIDFSGTGGVTLNGQAYQVIHDTAGLNTLKNSLNGYYVLGSDITDQSAENWTGTIGTSAEAAFGGVLNGFGHRLTSFTNLDQGLFGYTAETARISNLGVINASFSGSADDNIGILAGVNAGQIINSFAGGHAGGHGGITNGTTTNIGGLVGVNSGLITNSYASASVYASNYAGGLVGENSGTVSNSYVVGNAVVQGNAYTIQRAGGFAAINSGRITNSYVNPSSINGPVNLDVNNAPMAVAGGFVGSNTSTGSISYAYVGGNRIASARGAGFVGDNEGNIDNSYVSANLNIDQPSFSSVNRARFAMTNTGTIAHAYWDKSKEAPAWGTDASIGTELPSLGGLSALPAGFDANYWGLSAGGYPILKTLPVYVTAGSGLQYGDSGAALIGNLSVSGLQWGDAASNVFTYNPQASLLSPTGYLNAGIYGVEQVLSSTSSPYTSIRGSIQVAPRVLTLADSGIVGNKTYDGSTQADILANITAANNGLVGLVADETLHITYDGAAFDNKQAGSNKTVNLSVTLSDGSGLASNYTLNPADRTTRASIDKAEIGASYTVADKTYDGNTTAVLTLTSVDGLIMGDVVNFSLSGQFDTADAGTGKTVVIEASLTGDDAINYTLGNFSNRTASILPRVIQLSGAKMSDGSATITAADLSIANLVQGDTVVLGGSATLAGAGAGAQPIIGFDALTANNPNYTLEGATGSVFITARALPVLANIISGIDSINTVDETMTIRQGESRAIIDWSSFDIGTGYSVVFEQPGTNAIALNRITGGDQSIISGNLSGNGRIFLINPNGVLFTGNAAVNLGSLVASTQHISNDDFLNGTYTFGSNTATGGIEVLGNISLNQEGGYIALLGNGIAQNGSLTARGGKVLLVGGQNILLDLDENGQLSGYSVALADKAVQVGGSLDLSSTSGAGGVIEGAGLLAVAEDLHVAASGSTPEAGGYWLLRAAVGDYAVGGTAGQVDGHLLSSILRAVDAKVSALDGEVHVNDPLAWSANTLTLESAGNVNINEALTVTGTGGFTASYGQSQVFVEAAAQTEHHSLSLAPPEVNIYGVVMARGQDAAGRDNNTFVGKINFNSSGPVRMGVTGQPLKSYQVVRSAEDLAALNAGTDYVLGSDINLAGYENWTPIASYSGILNGFGHLIRNLTSAQGGLFQDFSASYPAIVHAPAADRTLDLPDSGGIHNLGLVDVEMNVSDATGSKGALAASSTSALIKNVFATGRISAQTDMTATEKNPGFTYAVGGLVGQANGYILDSYTSVDVSTVNFNRVGGFIGEPSGYIGNSYATGKVSATVTNPLRYRTMTGGFAGGGNSPFRIADSWASGEVTSVGMVGGFVGNVGVGSDIFNSRASGSITLVDNNPHSLDNEAGGFAGVSWGSVMFSASEGAIASVSGDTTHLGGFTGRTVSSLGAMSIGNYFNGETAGLWNDGMGNHVPDGMGQEGNTPILDAFNERYGTNLTPEQFHGGAVALTSAEYEFVDELANGTMTLAEVREVLANPVGGGTDTNPGGTDANPGGVESPALAQLQQSAKATVDSTVTQVLSPTPTAALGDMTISQAMDLLDAYTSMDTTATPDDSFSTSIQQIEVDGVIYELEAEGAADNPAGDLAEGTTECEGEFCEE